MDESCWETFDGLFKTLHRQGRRVEELEARVVELERRLQERATTAAAETVAAEPPSRLKLLPPQNKEQGSEPEQQAANA